MESNNLLYHYTDIKAAIGILKSGVLFFSNFQNLNDREEFIYPDPFVEKTYEKAKKELIYEKKEIYESNICEIILKCLGKEFFIFSTTQHDDKYEKNNGSLIMWRGYGRKCGCAIVFDKNHLELILNKRKSLISGKEWGGFIHGNVHCFDVEQTQDIENAFGETYNKFLEALKAHIKKEGADLLTPYVKIKSLLKHHAFSSEQEYRLGILRSIESTKNDEQLIPVENGRIKLPIAEQGFPIKKIIVSPIGDYQDINVDFLKWFIQSDPRYHGIEVTKSAIPHI